MTTQVLAPAPFAQFQTLGASYIADARGVIAAAAIDDVIDLIRGGCVLLPSYDNLSATSDPSASNDNTQGYTVGSRWVNSTTPNSNADWQLMAHIFKFGATGSNTQYAQGTAVRGGVHGGTGLPVFRTALESSALS